MKTQRVLIAAVLAAFVGGCAGEIAAPGAREPARSSAALPGAEVEPMAEEPGRTGLLGSTGGK